MKNKAVIINESFYCIHLTDCDDDFSEFKSTTFKTKDARLGIFFCF